ncbi:hypothetical protein SOVF_046700 [Spinacia oleracea]|nr:hypothetical protein SOVF_046700 [Spinacia oleracea]
MLIGFSSWILNPISQNSIAAVSSQVQGIQKTRITILC